MDKTQIEQVRGVLREYWSKAGHKTDVPEALCDLAIDGLKFREIQALYAEEYRLRDSVKAEMAAKGQEGVLWKNGLCTDWPAYVAATAAREQAVESIVSTR